MLKTDHIVFPVWDAGASLAFYREVMGLRLVETHSGPDWGGYPWLMMIFAAGDGREIVLVALEGARKPKSDGLACDVRHIAFGETSLKKLDTWREKLAAAGVEFREEAHGPRQSLYFEDPNGSVLEITAPPSRPARQESAKALAAAQRWIARA